MATKTKPAAVATATRTKATRGEALAARLLPSVASVIGVELTAEQKADLRRRMGRTLDKDFANTT